MACATCGKTILFGGKRAGSKTYCNTQCFNKDSLARFADNVPAERIDEVALQLRNSQCPACRMQSNVEVFKSYFVFSVVVLTRWRGKSELSCRSCARKRLLTETLGSLFLGWWGFPFGLIVTPIILFKNGVTLISDPLRKPPSKALKDYARVVVAHQISTQASNQRAAAVSAALGHEGVSFKAER